jgi:hypothetical protein
VERKKASIEMETAIKLILFLLSVIVVFSIFKLVVSKVFTNIGIEMCSISFSLEKKSQETSFYRIDKKIVLKGASWLMNIGCKPTKEKIKISSKEDLLISLLMNMKKICDITGKGSLEHDEVNLVILEIKSSSNQRIDIDPMEVNKLRDAKIILPNGRLMDLTLADYCNNVVVLSKFNSLEINNEKIEVLTLSYKNENGNPIIYVKSD